MNYNKKDKKEKKKAPKSSNKSIKNTKGKKTTAPKKKVAGKNKLNLISKSGLKPSIKKKLMDHAITHSQKHLGFMIGKIENGKNFSESHMLAMNSVGK